MQSPYEKHSRHPRARRDDEDLLIPRAGVGGSKGYDRPGQNYRQDSYRTGSSSSRSHYNDLHTASSHRQDPGWRSDSARASHDRYSYSEEETFSRSSRDLYDPVTSVRTHDIWDRRVNEGHRTSLADTEWSTKHRDTYTPTSNYPVRGSWDSSSAYENGHTTYNDWPHDDLRHRHSTKDRSRHLTDIDDRHTSQEHISSSSWRREDAQDRHGKSNSQHDKKLSASKNWQSQGRNSGGKKGKKNPASWNSLETPKSSHASEPDDQGRNESKALATDDRSWEPAPAWKASEENSKKSVSETAPDMYPDTRGRSDRGAKKTSKADKRKGGFESSRQSIDSRKSIWPHRDVDTQSAQSDRSSGKRRHQDSLSRSPASSASRERSRSRSISPKRRRKEHANPSQNGRSATDQREHSGRRHALSPANRTRVKRGRSLSSSSRTSRSRSRSVDKDKPSKHRLPAATSVKDITTSMAQSKRKTSHMPPPRDTNSHRNGQTRTETSGTPTVVAPSSSSYPSSTGKSPTARKGFKPIGRVNPSLKHFFPGDEDDNSEETASTQLNARVNKLSHDQKPASSLTAVQAGPTSVATVKLGVPSPSSETPLPLRDISHQDKIEMMSDVLPDVPEAGGAASDPGNREQENESISPTPHASLYAIVSQVGEGTFGKVYKARNTLTQTFVALKRIRMESERDGFPVTAMREIKLLQSLNHANIVCLYEMMVSNGSVHMVFEYMDHDLTGILSQSQFAFSDANLKSLCGQMLSGLAYLHHKAVIHRDIKGSNILVNNRGELKIADFGLARFYQKRRQSDYTNRVITLWYRPPELLYGATMYGAEVDIWSAGCIMLELFTKKPVFQGNDELHQLSVIYKIFGTPDPNRWPAAATLPWYELVKIKDVIPDRFREFFNKWLSPAALDLAERLLAYDPAQRITAAQALEAPYFTSELPPAELPIGLSQLEGEWHELETKRERAKKRRRPETDVIAD